MRAVVVGLNPGTAPRALWDAVLASGDGHEVGIVRPVEVLGIREQAVVADAGRIECYMALEQGRDALAAASTLFAAGESVLESEYLPHLYMGEGLDAAAHLFSVACGVDSFSTGGRSLDAVRRALMTLPEGASEDSLLLPMFQRAVRLGERASGEADAGGRSVVLAAVAADVAERVFDDLSRREVLLVGGGELCEAAAGQMLERGASRISVVHHARGYAEAVARSLGGSAFGEEDALERIACADIAIFSKSPQGVSLDAAAMKKVRRSRRGRMLLLMDLSQDGALDPSCSRVDDVFVYTLAELERLAESLAASRRPSQDAISRLVSEAVFDFEQSGGLLFS